MKVEGRLFRESVLLAVESVTYTNEEVRFSKELENSLILLCRKMDIPVPLWLDKNTKEFAAFRQTIFFSEQFSQEVEFERFQFKLCD